MDKDDIARSTRPDAAEPGAEPDSFDLAVMTEADVAAEIARRMTSWRCARHWPDSDEPRGVYDAPAARFNGPGTHELRADGPPADEMPADESPADESSAHEAAADVAGRSIAERLYSAEFAALLTAAPMRALRFRRLADGRRDWRMIGRATMGRLAACARTGRRSWDRLSRRGAAAYRTASGVTARVRSSALRALTDAATALWRDVSQLPADMRSVADDIGIVAGRAVGRLNRAGRVALERGVPRGRDIARVIAAGGAAIAAASTATARKAADNPAWGTVRRTPGLAAVVVAALVIAGLVLMPLGQTDLFRAGPFTNPAAPAAQRTAGTTPAPDLRRAELPKLAMPTRVVVFAEAAAPATAADIAKPGATKPGAAKPATAKPGAVSGMAPPTLIAALKPTTRKAPPETTAAAPATFETPLPPPEGAQLIAAPQIENDAPPLGVERPAEDRPHGAASADADDGEGDHGDGWMFDWVYGEGVQDRLPRRHRRAARPARRRTGTDR